MGEETEEPTRLLRRAAGGDRGGAERLVEVLQGELRGLAERAMAQERAAHTLQPTALVHEAWLKLFDGGGVEARDRRHFLALAARAMRQVLVDHARGRQRLKRGGGAAAVALDADGLPEASGAEPVDLVAVDEALEALRERAPRQAQVVELRFFGGLTPAEIAEVLAVSERTVERDWRFARAWLSLRLEGAEGP